MKIAICPGTFDPITKGHIDIIARATAIFDKVIVAIVKKPAKKTLFSYEERVSMVGEAVKDLKGVEAEGFEGLVVEYAQKKGARAIIRGLRMISDFEYEFQMAMTNRSLSQQVETVLFMPHPEYSYISSRLIKEAAFLGADLSKFLPARVLDLLSKKVEAGRQD